MEKYYIIFEDYRLSITLKNYLGLATEIFGNITLKKGEVDTILEPIRGTGLNLALEANQNLTFDEFALADEQSYYVQLKKGNTIIYNGFIKPDGMQQSWVNNDWLVNIEVIDGLGAMKDLSFVQSNGLHFTGKLSFYEVIKGCLDRTGILMPIYSNVELSYDGYAGTNILKDTYVNASRYVKQDGETIMNCNEVLESILNIFSAVITQENGVWWIYRPTDLKANTVFINNTTDAQIVVKTNYVLGSQIDNYYPHHCDANQQIEMKGAISAYRLRYEHGFIDGFLDNKELVHDKNLNFDNWTVLDVSKIVNDPLDLTGLKMDSFIFENTEVIKSNPFTINDGSVLKLTAKLTVDYSASFFIFKIKRSDGLYCDNNGNWSSNVNNRIITKVGTSTGGTVSSQFEFKTAPVNANLTAEVFILKPSNASVFPSSVGILTEVEYIDVTDSTQTETGIIGDFYTVSRNDPPSSIVKENQTVYNGDGTSLLIGSLYKADKTTLTTVWNRKEIIENKPILQISAEDDLRVQRNAIKVFSGGIYGQLPYLSIISINNIVGKFMFTNYSYDLRSNKMTAKLTQLYQDELGDILADIRPDYGNTVKPTIKG